jgi:glutamate racemase
VLRALRYAVPEAAVCYVADDARFPYGALDDEELASGLCAVLAEPVRTFAPDVIVIACNTASTVALPALRARFREPVVGTVPAIKPAAQISTSGLVSVLGTSSTVRRDYTRALIAEHADGCRVTLVGSSRLAGIAETVLTGGAVEDSQILVEIGPCFVNEGDARTDVVALACTHYPLLVERFDRLAPWPVRWLDPAPAIARRTANVLADLGFAVGVGIAPRETGQMIFTSGRAPAPALAALIASHGLALAKTEHCN